jgi:hypothetical protein
MRKTGITLMALLMAASACMKETYPTSEPTMAYEDKLVGGAEGEIIKGSLLVRLDLPEGSDVSSLFEGSGIISAEPALKVTPRNVEVADKYGLLDWYELRFEETVQPQAIAEKIAGNPSKENIFPAVNKLLGGVGVVKIHNR